MPDDREGGGRVALDVGAGDENDGYGGGGGGGICVSGAAAHDALQVCALEVPACAIRGPDLGACGQLADQQGRG